MNETRLASQGLPSDITAERAVLGAILLGSDLLRAELCPDDFHLDAHRHIWRAMVRLGAEGVPLDYVTLGAQLGRDGVLDAAGGYPYLAALTDGLPWATHLEHYAGIVRERSRQRRLLTLAAEIEQSVMADQSASEIAARVERQIAPPEESAGRGALFVDATRFLATVPDVVEWLVEGVVPRGANGLIGGLPGSGKSWVGIDFALALALGQPFLDFHVPAPARVALMSREDPARLTGWRMNRLLSGRGGDRSRLDGLWVNTQDQSSEFLLDHPRDVAEVVARLRDFDPEVVILDVLNVLHGAEENDNTAMRAVMRQVNGMQQKLGCAMVLIHHFRKRGAAEGVLTMAEQFRGASAIGGWRQWVIGCALDDDAGRVRKMSFELKASAPPDALRWRVDDDGRSVRLLRAERDAAPEPRRADWKARAAGA